MQLVRDVAACPRPPHGTVVTIGAFDGVHQGHQAVIRQVRRMAGEQRFESAVVTFDRHPASVVRPESAPKLLTDLEQKVELLAGTGIDYTLVVPFDEARSKEPAEEFVTEVLVGCLDARVVVVGDDFHFGHQRRGNVALLREMGAEHGFDVVGIELVGLDDRGAGTGTRSVVPAGARRPVSSTAIREALRGGDLDGATEMLGRPHEVRGVVVDGDKRARDLGFPTANVAIPTEICLPHDGIYAGWYLRPDGIRIPAALSLGRRPTFYEHADSSLLEAHLLDFRGDLYGEVGRVQFVAHLRDELRFSSVDALVQQMARDVERAREMLARPDPRSAS